MKKLFLLFALVISITLLSSCEFLDANGSFCQHRDMNDDAICDKCDEKYSDGIDKELCQHYDADDNGYCDNCLENYSDGADCHHRDINDDNKCDNCKKPHSDGKDIPATPLCQHRDINDDAHCDKCNEKYSDGKDVEHSHAFGDWIKYGYDANTPCDEQLFYRTCSSCGSIEWKSGGYEAHSFETVTTPPTCLEQGYDTKTCSGCGLTEIENYVAATDHSYKTEYSHSNSFHWHDCEYCDASTSKVEHTIGSDGFCTLCSHPLSPTEGIVYDLSADGTYAEVIGYSGTATKINIASTYSGIPVTKIYNEAFKNNNSITSVVIPDSVTSIGSSAFYNCDSLTSVTIGSGVTKIGVWAFSSCYTLTNVIIHDGVASIGSNAFYGCYNLTDITIPDSVVSIGNDAFHGCSPALYTEYEYGKYVGDANNPYAVLVELTNKNFSTYTINENTKHIAYGVFQDCERLTSITIPDSVISIGDSFQYCSSLTSVVIGNGVTSIGNYAFYDCSNLTSVTIPDSVTSIGDYAFYDCSNLTSVTIPDSVTSIGNYAFYAGFNLTTINYRGSEEQWNAISKGEYWNPSNATIVYNYTEE